MREDRRQWTWQTRNEIFFYNDLERDEESQKVDAGAEISALLVFILKPEVAPHERRYARREPREAGRETLC